MPKTAKKSQKSLENVGATKMPPAAKINRVLEAEKNKGGRPEKLTPELQKTICDTIAAGNYMETAAASAGIAKTTFNDWLRKGARSNRNDKYKRFSLAVEKAIADAEILGSLTIELAAAKTWQAAAWKLERMHPKKWGRKALVKIEGPDGDGAFENESVNKAIVDELDRIEGNRWTK